MAVFCLLLNNSVISLFLDVYVQKALENMPEYLSEARYVKHNLRKKHSERIISSICILMGITFNVVLASFTYGQNTPLYFDTIGTLAVAMLCGYFPGILTAVMTNMICGFFNPDSVYFSIVNALTALTMVEFMGRKDIRKIKNKILLILELSVITGIVGGLIQWRLFGQPQNTFIGDSVSAFSQATGVPAFLTFIVVEILVNVPDKGISFMVAYLVVRFLPEKLKKKLRNSTWRQVPLSEAEKKDMRRWSKDNKRSVRTRMTLTMSGMAILLVIIMFWVGIRLYFENAINERTEINKGAANFVSQVVDGDSIAKYIKYGVNAPGYLDTEQLMYKIRDNAYGVQNLSVIQIDETDITFVFDLDANMDYEGNYHEEPVPGYEPGETYPVDGVIAPFLDDFLAGKDMPSIPIKTQWNYFITSYTPIFNSEGKCVAYACADTYIQYLSGYMRDFLVHITLMMAGLFLLILAYGIWTAGTFLVYPINSIVMAVERFIKAGSDQQKLDEVVKDIRTLEINTEDEVEKLYYSVCDMTLNQTEQMRSIRRYTDATAKMQDGLIITMADLVENRDSDTGAHIQKMASYVKIIGEGLMKKGYYAGKVTPQFISDIVRSAPLHDIGKINIPDSILNKPGKLTPEEFEIMKTHTSAGEKIMEKAISTVEGENYLKEARNMAAYHHERWDGKGYPEGLHGEVIPLSARITSVADVFDALTSTRVYKPAFPLEEALALIQEGSGTQFDPKCVEVFMESLPEVKVILRKYNESV
ncbi:Response regulator c-di-GMP phosphodiesterase, RpfG family, contains REC and HD-GYP domains [Lachnospiraceae bacterium YSD2013]|nr:Response regulator c-di-GMP phosphodiesterase, RpfG family, contains REC and HD-GYP domains [Lachnospiraceae bacterium YSD2013]